MAVIVTMIVATSVAVCVIVPVPVGLAVCIAATTRVVALVGVGVVIGVTMSVPVGLAMHMSASGPIGDGRGVAVGMRVFLTRIARNPLRLGVSARFTVVVTVSFGGAGVRHGGFLARFVV
jgi:hypothetical protein